MKKSVVNRGFVYVFKDGNIKKVKVELKEGGNIHKFARPLEGNSIYRLPLEEGVVKDWTLWLIVEDDEKAKKLFIEYAKNLLDKTNQLVKKYKANIKTIEKFEIVK